MDVDLRWILVFCTISISLVTLPSTVNSDPIKIDYDKCQDATYPTAPGSASAVQVLHCCPIKPTKAIVDGIPSLSTKKLRIRQASQCTDKTYEDKLNKAYELMRALPSDDPRSFEQQANLHCSYCGGAFVSTNSSGYSQGVDIHFSWLFYPWHRYFLFFHERILQSLLGDPTFSLNFWNWDSPWTVGTGAGNHNKCLKEGDIFPAVFNEPSQAQYDVNRSANAKGHGRLHFPDFTYNPLLKTVQQHLYNASEEDLISSNLNVLYQNIVSGATTKEIFMGRPYHAGDSRGNSAPSGGAGSLEQTAHAGVHFWTGQDFPIGVDMGQLAFSAHDPVFFAHHSNLDRLWQVWKDIGPILGQNREYYSDPDFLDAEFLFYDENADLRRVYVRDALDTKNFGYVYEEVNDAAWIFLNVTRCSKQSNLESVALAESLPAPVKDDKGYYHLQGGKSFIITIDRPDNYHGLEEFLTIDGIKLDRHQDAGFDVFVDLVYPYEHTAPSKCAEYTGRFMNMAQSFHASSHKSYQWKQSVTKTLVDIQAASAPSKLVITLVPMTSDWDTETIKFKSIAITTD